MKKTNAQAKWTGTIKEGIGKFILPSTNYETSFSFASRFEKGEQSNPEELIGAALAGCFSMALSLELEEAGSKPNKIETNAEVSIVQSDGGFAIDEINLNTNAEVEDIEESSFKEIANQTKENCPVSKALKGVKINLQANLI